ncbi:MAG: ribonuclease P protein component [Armatimonadetes bacterium]|nr:ribonuclease P protein component [Armatimonadota bacterium]
MTAKGDYIRVVATSGQGYFGFAIARTIGCHARRNRLRRRLRSIVVSTPTPAHLDFCVVGLRNADRAPHAVLKEEFTQLIARIEQEWEERSASG